MLVTEITAQSIDEALKKQLEQLNVSVESREVGTVIQVGDGIARVDGLRDAMDPKMKAAGGETDLSDAVRTAVINKRAGGMGLILGRKAFKKSMSDGVKLINAVQDVYLDGKVTIA